MSGASERLRGFLAAHPVALLLLLTPGIPEYLSGSSALNALVINPVLFVFQIVANLGLYGSGTLLIYEAKVRWRKGWATVLLLGGAYGILEEGVALSTLFDPKAGPVGSLGVYGHWAGVNWVWAGSIVPFHALFSISLPLALLGLALPQTAGKSLLSRKRIAVTACTLAADVAALMLVVNRVNGFWMGTPVLLGSLAAIGLLVLAARMVSPRVLNLKRPGRTSPRKLAALGVAFFPAILLAQGLGQAGSIPPALDLGLELMVQGMFLAYVARRGGLGETRRNVVPLAAGLVVPIALFGLFSELTLPLILVVDLALALFLRRLWRGETLNQTEGAGGAEAPSGQGPPGETLPRVTGLPGPGQRFAFASAASFFFADSGSWMYRIIALAWPCPRPQSVLSHFRRSPYLTRPFDFDIFR